MSGFEYGTGITYEPGVVGEYAARFDGNTGIIIPRDYLYPRCNGTISVWVKVDPSLDYNASILGSKTNFKTNTIC